MITSASIENFKGFKHLDLPDISRITLLGGRNNVGKTSVLEALFLFFNRMEPGMLLRHLSWRGIETIQLEPDIVWAPLFRNYHMRQPIIISIRENAHREKMEIVLNPSYTPKSIEVQSTLFDENLPQLRTDQKPFSPYTIDVTYTSGNKIQKTHLIMRSNRIQMQVEQTEVQAYPALFIGARVKTNPTEDAVRFGQLDIMGKQDMVVKMLQTLEPRLTSLSTVATGRSTLIHGDIGIGRKFPVAFMGEGMDRLLSIILALATTRNGMVMIDEIENGFHHSVMAKVWEAISAAAREFNCQIMATTHSYECLQAAVAGVSLAGLPQEFRYIRLDQRDKDITATTYSHDELRTAVELGWEVR